jgi:hypothetical protein
MTEQTFNLKGGVLIIGSLLWQDNVRGENTIRRDWRDGRLDIDSSIGVKVPIRYGRISRDGIYTMTFANSCRGKNIGTAFAVPFQNNPITNLTQLMTEASELATAEGMSRTFISSNKGQPWCVLGILFNKSKIAHTDKVILSNWWLNELSQDDDFTRFNAENFKLGSERPCIYPNGLLSIPWIAPINNNDKNSLDQFDFLIATATLPNEDKYPSISKLYKAVKSDNDRKYFRNNFSNGITTFQDNKVNKKLTQ